MLTYPPQKIAPRIRRNYPAATFTRASWTLPSHATKLERSPQSPDRSMLAETYMTGSILFSGSATHKAHSSVSHVMGWGAGVDGGGDAESLAGDNDGGHPVLGDRGNLVLIEFLYADGGRPGTVCRIRREARRRRVPNASERATLSGGGRRRWMDAEHRVHSICQEMTWSSRNRLTLLYGVYRRLSAGSESCF